MTKVMTDAGWVYIVIVLDWHTKKVVGHYAGDQSKSWHWLIALNRAVCRQFPHGAREAGQTLHLMADNGCQLTSRWLSCRPHLLWASNLLSPATTTRRATPTPSDSYAPLRKNWLGCASGPRKPHSSPRWTTGSGTTTPHTSTPSSATNHPKSLNKTTSTPTAQRLS